MTLDIYFFKMFIMLIVYVINVYMLLFIMSASFCSYMVAAMLPASIHTTFGNADSPYISIMSIQYPEGYEWKSEWESDETKKIRLGISTKEEFKLWLKEFETTNKVTYRVLRYQSAAGKYALFKAVYRCQHNTFPHYRRKVGKTSKKHTDCPVQLSVTIKAVHKRSRSADCLLKEYPTIVTLHGNHNHDINTVEALKYRDPSDEVRSKFLEMFKAGHAPLRALELHRRDLIEEHGDGYHFISNDRYFCPDQQWVYQLFYKVFQKQVVWTKMNMIEIIIDKVQELANNDFKITCSTTGEDYCIALCTPFMERVHQLPTSADIAFVDSSNYIEQFNCHIYLIMIDSCMGGLPIGVLITSSEKEELLTIAWQSYLELVPSGFAGKGAQGPQVFVTGDSVVERNTLNNCFPNTTILLSTFHILQQVWQWTLNPKHGIHESDWKEMFVVASTILNSKNEPDLEMNFEAAFVSAPAQKYPSFVTYLKTMKTKSLTWAFCFRNNVSIRGTNDLTEYTFLMLKDAILMRSKAFSAPQLLQYIFLELPEYYERRLKNILEGNLDLVIQSLCQPDLVQLQNYIVQEAGDNFYEVMHLGSLVSHQVKIDLGLCSCFVGKLGGPCKHQHVVAIKENIISLNALPTASEDRLKLFWVITGLNETPEDWLNSTHTNSVIAENDMMYSVPEYPSEEEDGGIAALGRAAASKTNIKKNLEFAVKEVMKRCEEDLPAFETAIEKFYEGFKNLSNTAMLAAFGSFGKTGNSCEQYDAKRFRPIAMAKLRNEAHVNQLVLPSTTMQLEPPTASSVVSGTRSVPQILFITPNQNGIAIGNNSMFTTNVSPKPNQICAQGKLENVQGLQSKHCVRENMSPITIDINDKQNDITIPTSVMESPIMSTCVNELMNEMPPAIIHTLEICKDNLDVTNVNFNVPGDSSNITILPTILNDCTTFTIDEDQCTLVSLGHDYAKQIAIKPEPYEEPILMPVIQNSVYESDNSC